MFNYPGFVFEVKKKSEYFLQTYYCGSIITVSEFLLPKLVEFLFTYAFVIHNALNILNLDVLILEL